MLIHKTSCELCQRLHAVDPSQDDTIIVIDNTGQLSIEIRGIQDAVDSLADVKTPLSVYVKYTLTNGKEMEWSIDGIRLVAQEKYPGRVQIWQQNNGTDWFLADNLLVFGKDNLNAQEDLLQKFNTYHGLKYGQITSHANNTEKILVGLYKPDAINSVFHGPVREYWTNGRPKFTGWYTAGLPSSGRFFDPYGILCVKISMIDKGLILPAYNLRLTIGELSGGSTIRTFETKAADLMSSCPLLSHRNIYDRSDFAEIVMRAHGVDYKQIAGEIYNVIDPQLSIRILVDEFTRSDAHIRVLQTGVADLRAYVCRMFNIILGILMVFSLSYLWMIFQVLM